MTTSDWSAFIGAMRAEMVRAGMDLEDLEVNESGEEIRLGGGRSEWYDVQRAHLDVAGGTPFQVARAVFDVYLEDR